MEEEFVNGVQVNGTRQVRYVLEAYSSEVVDQRINKSDVFLMDTLCKYASSAMQAIRNRQEQSIVHGQSRAHTMRDPPRTPDARPPVHSVLGALD